MKSFKFGLLFIIIFSICQYNVKPLLGNDENQNKHNNLYFVNLGFGFGSLGLSSGICLHTLLNKHNLTFRYMQNIDYNFSTENERISDIAILYGLNYRKSNNIIFASLGFAYVSSELFGNKVNNGGFGGGVDLVKNNTFGLVFETQFLLSMSPNFGFGFNFYGNYNEIKPFIGMQLSIYCGLLR